jgi:pSer/pThr/pTyr-binding forkhead associated (FHA) protein
MVTPPPMISPGGLGGGMGVPAAVPAPMAAPVHAHAPAAAPGSHVLVGFLVTFQNDPGGSFWPIYSGRTQMGRSVGEGGADIGLSDASASSRHASIHADPSTGQGFIEDDGSRNGTFLNEQRLQQGERRQLRDNDRLRLGSTTFVVKLLVS